MKTNVLKQQIMKLAAMMISLLPVAALAGGPANGNNNTRSGLVNASPAGRSAKSAAERQTSAILSLKNDPLMQDFLVNDTNNLSESEVTALQKIDKYLKGEADADDNFRSKKSYRRAIFLTSLIGGPVAGIIPSAVGAASVPSDSSLNMPKSILVNDDEYVKGYKHEAHCIKKHGTWGRYIVASLIWLAAANIVLR